MIAKTTTDKVTRAELKAHIEPMKKDIAEIKKAVEPIPAIYVETQATNSKVADHETAIGKLQDWQQRLIGAGGVIIFFLGVFGVYLLREVL